MIRCTYLKNAWKNIIRNKGRNILIGIIVIVIAAASSITLAIRESANDNGINDK